MMACASYQSYILLSFFVSLHSFNPSSFCCSLLPIHFSCCSLFFCPSCPPFWTSKISLFSPRSRFGMICAYPSSRALPLRCTWGATHIRPPSNLQIGHKSPRLGTAWRDGRTGLLTPQNYTYHCPFLSAADMTALWICLSSSVVFQKNWMKCSPSPALTFLDPSWLDEPSLQISSD